MYSYFMPFFAPTLIPQMSTVNPWSNFPSYPQNVPLMPHYSPMMPLLSPQNLNPWLNSQTTPQQVPFDWKSFYESVSNQGPLTYQQFQQTVHSRLTPLQLRDSTTALPSKSTFYRYVQLKRNFANDAVKAKFIRLETQHPKRISFCLTEWQKNILANSTHLFIDGTFKYIPMGYAQLMIVLSYDYNSKLFIPVAFCLLEDKTEFSYDLFFKTLREFVTSKTKFITSDFERGLYNQLRAHLNTGIKFIGCYFHFVKALRKKMKKYFPQMSQQKILLDHFLPITLCVNTPEKIDEFLANFRSMLISLETKEGPLETKPFSEKDIETFITYFRRQWISKNGFTIESWNVHAINNEELLFRSNCALEAYNRHFRTRFGKITLKKAKLAKNDLIYFLYQEERYCFDRWIIEMSSEQRKIEFTFEKIPKFTENFLRFKEWDKQSKEPLYQAECPLTTEFFKLLCSSQLTFQDPTTDANKLIFELQSKLTTTENSLQNYKQFYDQQMKINKRAKKPTSKKKPTQTNSTDVASKQTEPSRTTKKKKKIANH
jgi:hypothetical protein